MSARAVSIHERKDLASGNLPKATLMPISHIETTLTIRSFNGSESADITWLGSRDGSSWLQISVCVCQANISTLVLRKILKGIIEAFHGKHATALCAQFGNGSLRGATGRNQLGDRFLSFRDDQFLTGRKTFDEAMKVA